MYRLSFLSALVVLAAIAKVQSFTASPSRVALVGSRTTTARYMVDDDGAAPRSVQRGVSVDQDGKSNVWAIEPKMEVSSKSAEEKTQSAVIAGAGIAVLAVAAAFILTNLPDPNQF